MRTSMVGFKTFLLTEGRVVDEAIAIAKKSIEKHYREGRGKAIVLNATDGRNPSQAAIDITANWFIEDETKNLIPWMNNISRFFQKRHGVPNADWMNWFAKDYNDNRYYMTIDDIEHMSDFLVGSNRMANFSFGRFTRGDDLRHAVADMEREAIDRAAAKKLSHSYPIDDLPDDEKATVGRRHSFTVGNGKSLTITATPDEYKVIVDCGNGYQWHDINKSYCSKEGASMMHCGNVVGQTTPSQRIFSLRKRVSGNTWMPFLTFIYDKLTRSLGEMKAAENQKPSAFFHPMIVKLLLAEEVEGRPLIWDVRGGGYAPEKNFSLMDLTEEQLVEVADGNEKLAWGCEHPLSVEFSEFPDMIELLNGDDIPYITTDDIDKLWDFSDRMGMSGYGGDKRPGPAQDRLAVLLVNWLKSVGCWLETGRLEDRIRFPIKDESGVRNGIFMSDYYLKKYERPALKDLHEILKTYTHSRLA